MKKKTFEKQKNYAGRKKPSMLRRCVGHDYTDRQIYMITIVTERRRPLFGQVVGKSDAPKGSEEEPQMVLSELGQRVVDEWWATEQHHPEIKVLALQMMPDHLHGILFVKEKMEKPLGMALRGFKQSCNKHYRGMMMVDDVALATQHTGQVTLATQHTGQVALTTQHTGQVALTTQHTEHKRGGNRTQGLLFERGYNDKLLLRAGQLKAWMRYLEDNPRRLLMKREHPDLFRVQRNVEAAGFSFSAIGNRFLLGRPEKVQVQCSRSLTEMEIQSEVAKYLTAARQGAVLVSPSISPGEKTIMRAAFEEGFPLIYLQENGFSNLAKPGGARMEACAEGRLLILAPWEHHNEKIAIRRGQCLELNEIARRICEG